MPHLKASRAAKAKVFHSNLDRHHKRIVLQFTLNVTRFISMGKQLIFRKKHLLK